MWPDCVSPDRNTNISTNFMLSLNYCYRYFLLSSTKNSSSIQFKSRPAHLMHRYTNDSCHRQPNYFTPASFFFILVSPASLLIYYLISVFQLCCLRVNIGYDLSVFSDPRCILRTNIGQQMILSDIVR